MRTQKLAIHFTQSAFIALGQMPSSQALQMITEIRQPAGPESPPPQFHSTSTRSSMGAGIPPVPEKMISRIEAGEYIEMAELLPDRLGSAGMTSGEDQTRVSRSRRKAVTNIFEWVECFAIYVAVLSRSQPQRVPEMLGYLILILEAHMEHGGDGWIGYDRRFRMTAAGNPSINWATIDTTLWQLAFSGKGKSSRCKHCFSLLHSSNDCEWGPEPSISSTWINPSTAFQPPMQQQQRRQICRDWNNARRPGCTRANCSYEHICFSCAFDPNIPDKGHKAVFCPYKPFQRQPGNWGKAPTQKSY